MPDLDMKEVERIADILTPRIAKAMKIGGEKTPEKVMAAINTLLLTAASVYVVGHGINRQAADALVTSCRLPPEAMAKTANTMHQDN